VSKRTRRSHRKLENKPQHWYAVLNERSISAEATDAREDVAAFCALHGVRRIRHPYARVDVSRNRIAKKFMDITTDPESALIMLDTDHLQPHDVVLRLIEDDMPVVGALAFRRGEPYDPQAYVLDGEDLKQPVEWKPGLLEVDIIGSAAICIRRKVFMELEEKGFHYPWFRMKYEDSSDTFLGEDWYFSEICRAAGIKLYCDMRIVPPHQDILWIDEKPWLMRQNLLIPDEKARMNPEPWFQEDNSKWAELKDSHKGETCIVIGNGPSLKEIPVEFLQKHSSFGTNRIYAIRHLEGFYPTYYCSVNPLVLNQFGAGMIQKYKGRVRRFFLAANYLRGNPIKEQPAVVPIQSLADRKFFPDPTLGLYEGHTVTFVCLQIAYWMGFSMILLVGVDHRYSFEGNPNQELVAQGPDKNHADESYFSDGTKWHAPDLEKSAEAYQMARGAFEADGRRIINLTPNSALDVFERDSWTNWGK